MNKFMFFVLLVYVFSASSSYASDSSRQDDYDRQNLFNETFDNIIGQVQSTYDRSEIISNNDNSEINIAVINRLRYNPLYDLVNNNCIKPNIPTQFNNENEYVRFGIYKRYYQLCIFEFANVVNKSSINALAEFDQYNDDTRNITIITQ